MALETPSGPGGHSANDDGASSAVDLLATISFHEGEGEGSVSIWSMAWRPDGTLLATNPRGGFLKLWNASTGDLAAKIKARHTNAFAWSPDGQYIAISSLFGEVLIVNSTTFNSDRKIALGGDNLRSLAWSQDGRFLAGGSMDGTVLLWETSAGAQIDRLQNGSDSIDEIAWSPDGETLAIAGDRSLRFWQPGSSSWTGHGHRSLIKGLAWSPSGDRIATGSLDSTIRIWDAKGGPALTVVEGHTDAVRKVSFSSDGQFLASNSWDGTVRIWDAETGAPLFVLSQGVSRRANSGGLAFHPREPILAAATDDDTKVRLWRLESARLVQGRYSDRPIKYATAKIVLVGDSGVGKTGLGWRLSHGEFKEQASTHGQQFWLFDDLRTTLPDGTECEAVLWDLAGQPDYRLVHALFLDDVDVALLLFDPTNRLDPLASAEFWINQLKGRAESICRCILVGARMDRGAATLTPEELDAFCNRRGIHGWVATSAMTGDGLPELMSALTGQLDWNGKTRTVTTNTFKRIKDFALSLKESADFGQIIVNLHAFRDLLARSDPSWSFNDDELLAALRHLETHGFVKLLRQPHGETAILLVPDLLANVASSIVLEARRNPLGLGVLEEGRLQQRGYRIHELLGLAEQDQDILTDTVMALFLQRNVCFRETFNQNALLVFPSLINEKRPIDGEIDMVEDAIYRIRGAIEYVYSSLVVLLGYTNTFVRTNQWRGRAQYEFGKGEVCGFEQTGVGEGKIELVIQYAPNVPEHTRLLFRGLFERFLSRHDVEIQRYQPVICQSCHERLARSVLFAQLAKGRNFSFCNECGERLALPQAESLTPLPPAERASVAAQKAIADRRTAFETALVKVKGLLRDLAAPGEAPSCFISYAWGEPSHERWVMQLAKDLRNAGVDVLLDRWHNPLGHDIGRFVDQITLCRYVAVVGTPKLREKYMAQTSDPVVAAELDLVNLRIRQKNKYGSNVIPLLLAGDADESLTPQLEKLARSDFRAEKDYFFHLLDVIWRLYDLPFDHPLLEELAETVRDRSLSG